MTGDFSADEYHDEYRQALMARHRGQGRRRARRSPPRRREPTKIADLMAALEASVAAARESRRTAAEAPAAAEPEAPAKPARRRKTA